MFACVQCGDYLSEEAVPESFGPGFDWPAASAKECALVAELHPRGTARGGFKEKTGAHRCRGESAALCRRRPCATCRRDARWARPRRRTWPSPGGRSRKPSPPDEDRWPARHPSPAHHRSPESDGADFHFGFPTRRGIGKWAFNVFPSKIQGGWLAEAQHFILTSPRENRCFTHWSNVCSLSGSGGGQRRAK